MKIIKTWFSSRLEITPQELQEIAGINYDENLYNALSIFIKELCGYFDK